ncbi:MAG: hypothetical protein ABIF89_01015, partial [bacterium]
LDKILKILKEEKIIAGKDSFKDIKFYRPKPSEDSPDGYGGRTGLYEVLAVTSTIKEMIVRGATADQLEMQAIKEGMITMVEDGFIKAVQGITSLEEVLRVIAE